jgi:hypothetical protein
MRQSIIAFSVALTALGPIAVAAQSPQAGEERKTTGTQNQAAAACADMMTGRGVSEEDGKAMREFMQSDKAPPMMTQMMKMARQMGNGDVTAGMTKMMDMMGSGRGGMMNQHPSSSPPTRER